MDEVVFDRLTRLFSSSRPRRDAIRAALGLVFGGAMMSRNPDALADGRNDELAGEAIASGRETQDFAGEQHRGRKRNDRNSCARAGQKRRRGKPCCRGLEKTSSGSVTNQRHPAVKTPSALAARSAPRAVVSARMAIHLAKAPACPRPTIVASAGYVAPKARHATATVASVARFQMRANPTKHATGPSAFLVSLA